MNVKQILVAGGMSTIMALAPVYAGNGFGGNPGTTTNTCSDCVVTELDGAEAATLTFMREEEKLARDVYDEMYAAWQMPLFDNIAAAEQNHMDAVKAMLDKYGLPDPAQTDVPGWFANQELQGLYDELVARGAASYEEALKVGALIEEVDIEDNQIAIDETDNADLQTVYGNLLRGSRNHLRAFVGELERLGVVYEAQHLDQETVDAIVDSPMERGGSNGSGQRGGGRR